MTKETDFITQNRLHDATLFLLKDQQFPLTKEGIADFRKKYKEVINLLSGYDLSNPPKKPEGTAGVESVKR